MRCYHVTYMFKGESITLCSCLNVKELLARNRCDSEGKASLTKWLGVRLRDRWLWIRIPLQSLRQGFACFCIVLLRA